MADTKATPKKDLLAVLPTAQDVMKRQLCTDRGRAIKGWEKTLTGLPKELYEFWEKHLKSRGYKIGCQAVTFQAACPETLTSP